MRAAGFLGVACAWILMQGIAAGAALKKPAAGASCGLKDLLVLTERRVEESLARFDEANGKHVGTWSLGFPELQVHRNSSPSGPKVQCSLHFMAQGMEKILKDQKNNLNPQDVSLHKKLRGTISRVRMLAVCVENHLGGKCSHEPPPPKMPKHVFERKQWSRTLLKLAGDYLDWLQQEVMEVSPIKEAKRKKHKAAKATFHNYLRGSVHQL
ncbi:uncharacterized protein LOC119413011 [Nematolebias whitei]|uniref:uncharacterized protein LOC119413011 n=1 Tax=Nematolebias whitei TaxID=451745 RepID=UPI001897A989|nr:uncharacterized protein LOC119413011 [Nematolebias whitei]